MKFPNVGTYLCYRKVGSDKWKMECELIGQEAEPIARKHPERQWAVFEVTWARVVDVEKTDL